MRANHIRGFACLAVFVCSCGGQPVGSKIPRANPAKVAGAAAAAAAITTLADPAAAKRRQEHQGGEPPKRGQRVTESAPEEVLLRAEEGADNGDKARPCKEEQTEETDKESQSRRDLFLDSDAQKPAPPRCKERDERQPDDARGDTKEPSP